MEAPHIQPGARVKLHLEIRLEDDIEVLSTFDGEALEITLGDGTLAAGLEGLLLSLTEGADERHAVNGSEIYGPRDESYVRWLPSSDFPSHFDPAPGQIVAFEDPGGEEIPGLILEAEGDRVRVDFNHPLSGRQLGVRIRILSVMDSGEAAGAG